MTDGNGDNVSSLSLDACLELLANRERRAIVGYFLAREVDDATIDELVSEILDEEATRTGERPGHDTVASTLFHVHLPKFADAGLLEYDTRNLEIRYHGDPWVEDLYRKIDEFDESPP